MHVYIFQMSHAAPHNPPRARYIVHRETFCVASEAAQLALLLAGAAAGCQHPLPPVLGGVLKLVMVSSCASLFYLQVRVLGWMFPA